jgi:hypothetical protein
MPLHSFNNEHDIVVWTLSYLLHRFEDSRNLFAAQCVWWVASLIQLTDILVYYHRYNIFPSEYQNQFEESSVSNTRKSPEIVPERDIPPLELTPGRAIAVVDTALTSGSSEHREDSEFDSEDINVRIQTVVGGTDQYLVESRRLRELHQLQHHSNPIKERKQRVTRGSRQDLIDSLHSTRHYNNSELRSIFGDLTKRELKGLRRQIKDSGIKMN